MNRRLFLGGAAGIAAGGKLLLPYNVSAHELPAEITDMSASALSSGIKKKYVSCVEVMQAYLRHIHKYNPTYNAIISMRSADELMAEARQADEDLARDRYRGWMHGFPHAVKDLADVKGLPTSQGSPILAGKIATQDSVVAASIRDAGAIFIGKTNTPEFGMGSQTYNSVFGATGSAYNPDLTAGGSSGGAASGLGTRMLPVADGSDMMGSLRNPGAYNNVIGFRPTYGRIPEGGGGDLFYFQLPVSGPMGRNTEDTIRLMTTIAGSADNEPLSLRDELPTASEFGARRIKGLRVGWLGNYDGYLEMEPGVLDLCEASLKSLSAQGAVVEPCKPDYDMSRLWKTWLTLRHWRSGAVRALYDNEKTRAQLKPEVIFEIEGSFDLSGQDIHEAGAARSDWFRAMRALFDKYDVLVLPTAQVFPFSKDTHWPKTINDREMETYHRWMEIVIGSTLASLPTVNVPVGFDKKGRPMGMQVIGPFGADRSVLEFALAYENVTDHLNERPKLVIK